MKYEKQHRYVSRLGPLARVPDYRQDIAQALAAAENEGWPIVVAHCGPLPPGRSRGRTATAVPAP